MWYLDQTVFDQVITLEKKHRKVMAMRHDRKARAIETIWFVTRLIDLIYPGKIEARWFGSFEEPEVTGYPFVKVNAFHILSGKVLVSWEIDTSGETEPPRLTADDIVSDILIAIGRLKKFQSL